MTGAAGSAFEHPLLAGIDIAETGLADPDLRGWLVEHDGDPMRMGQSEFASFVLSESAIAGPEDARRARDAGADAVLVGTSILRAREPGAAIDALVGVGWTPR